MRFTDQKERVATDEDVSAPWGGEKNGKRFRCYLCGYKFKVGDTWRWVAGKWTINFLVCQPCDGEDVQERFKAHNEYGEQAFWWKWR